MILLILSGVFSASETALMSLSPAKVRTLVEGRRKGSKYLAKLKHEHHRTLITILVGNNFVNIAAASLTTVLFTETFGSSAVGMATGILTMVVLVFGEILPKSFATTYAERMSLILAPPLYIMGIILMPLILILDLLVKSLLKLTGGDQKQLVTDEELIAMASIGEEEGSLDAHERELIENVLEFNDIHVEEIMTPRVHIDAMPENYDLDEAANFIVHHTHSRIPVYRETLNNIVGICSVKDLLTERHDLSEEEHDEVTLRNIQLRPPLRVVRTMKVQDLFKKFKKKRTHIAIVTDKDGRTAGLVTMEDLIEEIVGDILDEEDHEETTRVKEIKPGLYAMSGRVELDELHKVTGLEFDFPEYKTLSFIIIEELGRLPKKGQRITIGNWSFKVMHLYRDTILKVEARQMRKRTS
ncbi:MAG: putative hemolysin [Oceanicoccus sp.]|jgi:putative hemolysin